MHKKNVACSLNACRDVPLSNETAHVQGDTANAAPDVWSCRGDGQQEGGPQGECIRQSKTTDGGMSDNDESKDREGHVESLPDTAMACS